MPAPETNTFTVTIADAHGHQVIFASVAASSKADAISSVMAECITDPSQFSAFNQSDNWTATVSQP